MKNLILISIILIFLLSGCAAFKRSLICNCDNSMQRYRAKYGRPTRITKYDARDYHTRTFWYGKDLAVDFRWGQGVKAPGRCCETSTMRW